MIFGYSQAAAAQININIYVLYNLAHAICVGLFS